MEERSCVADARIHSTDSTPKPQTRLPGLFLALVWICCPVLRPTLVLAQDPCGTLLCISKSLYDDVDPTNPDNYPFPRNDFFEFGGEIEAVVTNESYGRGIAEGILTAADFNVDVLGFSVPAGYDQNTDVTDLISEYPSDGEFLDALAANPGWARPPTVPAPWNRLRCLASTRG